MQFKRDSVGKELTSRASARLDGSIAQAAFQNGAGPNPAWPKLRAVLGGGPVLVHLLPEAQSKGADSWPANRFAPVGMSAAVPFAAGNRNTTSAQAKVSHIVTVQPMAADCK